MLRIYMRTSYNVLLASSAGCSGSVYLSMFPFQMYSLILELENVDHHFDVHTQHNHITSLLYII